MILETPKKGKVARLSASLRAEVIRRRTYQRPAEVLKWLNSLPEVKRMIRADFGGFKITVSNLRNGLHARPVHRIGKIARLPRSVREEVNMLLLDGKLGREIVEWVNNSQKLHGAAAITPQSLSTWRAGGFKDWLTEKGLPDMPRFRRGKIARLPAKIRNEINMLLLDGKPGVEIVAWVNNSLNLGGASAVTPQNLSEWRAGGFRDWKKSKGIGYE